MWSWLNLAALVFWLWWPGVTAGPAHPLTRQATSPAASVVIHITGSAQPPGFQPSLLTIHAGDTIVFENDATPSATYSVAAADRSFASPPIAPGQQWSLTLDAQGVHEYHSPNSPQQMVGELIVAPASVTLLPTPEPGAVTKALADIRAQRNASHVQPYLLIGGVISGVLLLVATIALVLRARRRQRKPPA